MSRAQHFLTRYRTIFIVIIDVLHRGLLKRLDRMNSEDSEICRNDLPNYLTKLPSGRKDK